MIKESTHSSVAEQYGRRHRLHEYDFRGIADALAQSIDNADLLANVMTRAPAAASGTAMAVTSLRIAQSATVLVLNSHCLFAPSAAGLGTLKQPASSNSLT